MSKTHINDQEIQQYLFDKENCKSTTIAHINSCIDCQEALTTYKELAVGLKELEVPSLNFDIAESIVAQLPAPAPKTFFIAKNKVAVLFMVLGILAIIMHNIAIPWIQQIKNLGVYFTLSTGLFIGILWVTDIIQNFQKKMAF